MAINRIFSRSLSARLSVGAMLTLHQVSALADKFIECDAESGCGRGGMPVGVIVALLALIGIAAVAGGGDTRDKAQQLLFLLAVVLGPALALSFVAVGIFGLGPFGGLLGIAAGIAVTVAIFRRLGSENKDS